MALHSDTTEFSRPVDITRLGDAETWHSIEAGPAERLALAARFGLVALDLLRADLTISRIRGGAAIRVKGVLKADVVQSCVVSLEPVRSRVEEPFEIMYAPESGVEEVGFGADTDTEWPELLPEGPLDIGEMVAQQLSLALDPYPRAPGAVPPEGSSGESRSQNPFARLASLRKIAPGSGEA